MKSIATILIFVATLISVPAAALKSDWKAGVASVVITPTKPMWMAGYASRTNLSQGKATDLFAKVLALEDARGTQLVVVTLDLIAVPHSLRRGVEEAVAREHRLPREGLLMNCSHTHSGPEFQLDAGPQDWAMFGKPGLRDALSPIDYGHELMNKVIEGIRSAMADRSPASVQYHHARCGFAMNRRTPVGTNYNNFPNPEGPVDHDVPVLRIDSGDGQLRAIVFGYACHNTTLAQYQFCGDYAGYAQRELQQAHPGATALFMMGCGGDQNPYPRGTFELAQTHGRTLATAVDAALQTRGQIISGPLRLAYDEVVLRYAGPATRADFEAEVKSSDTYEVQHGQRMLARLAEGGKLPEEYSFPAQIIRFGPELTLVALAGETCVDYSLRLKKELAASNPWIAGYCNDVMAYIPSARLLREGGYEPRTSMFLSEIHPGPWAADLEERIIGKVHELYRRVRE